MLFSNRRRHAVSLPAIDGAGRPANIAFLIDYLCKNLMKDPRTDLFVLDNHMYVHYVPSRCDFGPLLTTATLQ
jgi:ubiquitin related modifier 1